MRTLLLTAAAAALAASPAAAKDKDANTIALFNLSGALTETPTAADDPFAGGASESLLSLTGRMRKAAADEDVKAVVLNYGGLGLGRAQAEELAKVIKEVKGAGKPVWGYADALVLTGYPLMAQADRLTLSPEGALIVTGIYGEQMFLRGMLDKIGVEPDFVALGDYKAAGEQFMRKSPSDFAQKNTDWLFDSLYESMLEMVAEGRGVDVAKAKEWINEGVYSATEATEKGLLDGAETREQFTAALEEKLGGEVKYDRSFGKAKSKTIDLSSPFGVMNFYADLLSGPGKKKARPDVAVVHVNGAIMDGEPSASPFGAAGGAYSGPIRDHLLDVAEDDAVKAVVLRVDSPGGSAIASEVILQACKIVAEKKPLVVSMGNVAASGGYYVSMAGERIFADAQTITGSIGVVSGKVATSGLFDKLGINFVPVERGENADLFSTSETWDDEQEAELKAWMNDAYKTFKGHVTANRGDKLSKPIDELAGGRVYTGEQGIENGLVDEIGGLREAVAYAADKAGLKEGKYEVGTVPAAKNFIEVLLADLQPKKDETPNRLGVAGPQAAPAASTTLVDLAMPLLSQVAPRRAAAVRDALVQAEIVRQGKVAVIAPIYLMAP